MIARPFAPGEAARRCSCNHVMVARAGDMCPRCHRLFPDIAAVQDALITVGRQHGPADVKRLAPVLGIEGDQLVTDGRRVFGVLEGGRS